MPAPIPSFPGPEIFLRTCLTIASSMAKTIRSSLGSQNRPQSRKNQSKSTKIDLFWKKVQNPVLHAEMAYLTLSEDPDSHFMVKNSIFRGLGRYLAVLGFICPTNGCMSILLPSHQGICSNCTIATRTRNHYDIEMCMLPTLQ